jgi:TetR/AcrR family transcriptional repressor of mexCD-oprJ operon
MLTHRADFTRNERRILDAAAQVLAAAPAAGMAEIATAAGLGRATVYRHFPTRELLLEGLRVEALDAASAVVERCVRPVLEGWDGAETPGAALRRLTRELVDVGDRYRLVLASRDDESQREEARRRFEEPLTRLTERAQETGELDASVPATWVLVALGGLLSRVLEELADQRLAAEEAKRIVARGLFDGFGARA